MIHYQLDNHQTSIILFHKEKGSLWSRWLSLLTPSQVVVAKKEENLSLKEGWDNCWASTYGPVNLSYFFTCEWPTDWTVIFIGPFSYHALSPHNFALQTLPHWAVATKKFQWAHLFRIFEIPRYEWMLLICSIHKQRFFLLGIVYFF